MSTVFRDIPFAFVEFPVWEALKHHLRRYIAVIFPSPVANFDARMISVIRMFIAFTDNSPL